MAFTYGFYNALNHDRVYDAKDMGRMFDGLVTDGIFGTIGNKFAIKATTGNNRVIVGSGRAWFNHTWSRNDADMPFTGTDPHVLYNRYDAIVLDIDARNSSRTNSIKWVEGTAASSPTKPTMIHEEDHDQYPLAYIYRRANNKTITESDIQNAIGSAECPYVESYMSDTKNIAPVDMNDKASKNYAVGDYLMWKDEFYKVTTAINQGVYFVAYPTTGYNIKHVTISDELRNTFVFDSTPKSGSYRAVTSDGIYKFVNTQISNAITSVLNTYF